MKEKEHESTYPKVTTWDVVKEYWKSAKFHWLLGASVLVGVVVSNLAQNIIAPLYYKEFFDALAGSDPSLVLTGTVLVSILF